MSRAGRLAERLRAFGSSGAKDPRGRRVVAVIECITNQNARDPGAATSAAMAWDVVRLCHEHGVGILQIPCPEREYLGLARVRQPGSRIRDALDTAEARLSCRGLSAQVAGRLGEHLRSGDRVLAVLGGNPRSPGCAVHEGLSGLRPDSGVLMLELQRELRARDIDVPFRGIRDADPTMLAEDLAWLERVFEASET